MQHRNNTKTILLMCEGNDLDLKTHIFKETASYHAPQKKIKIKLQEFYFPAR